MAEARQLITNPEQADDRKIPVFTVLKNNTILKNIFLLQAPPEMNNFGGDIQSSGNSSNSLEERDRDAILTVGRHPSCSIVLSHPSISRFHLQIRSKPSVEKLSVTDLSSVHGTWVFGKRIKPRDSVELKEGDELRMGGSSRVYKLHWVSACQAYDLDHPFFPASDVIMCEDIEKQEEEAEFQVRSFLDIVFILEPLLDSFVFTEKDAKESCGFKSGQSDFKSQSPETPFYMKCITHNGNRKGSKTVSNQSSNKSTASSQRCQSLSALKTLNCSSKEKRRGSSTAARTLHYSNAHGKSVLKPLLANLDGEEDTYEIYTPDKENFTPNTRLLKSMKKMDILDDVEVNSSRSYTSLNVSSSPSQSQKATSKALLADLGSAESEVEIYTPDKENFTPNTLLLKSMKRMGLLDENKINSSVSDNSRSTKISGSPYLVEQKYCNASEKENGTPLIDQEQTSPTVIDHTGNKKKLLSVHRKAERIPLQSLSNNSSFRSKSDASINKVAIKSRGSVTRAKFQRKNSPIKNNIALEAKVKWYMIVDSTCFVDSESRKALQLLQGLRGTKLIVPGTVLRELDAMNQHASLFRGTTKASAALQWLEDCLVNTKWWIHVQSFFEEVRHLAPTPPASPKLHNSYHQTGIKSWKTLPIFRSFSEVPSPKAEDHILEYALQQMRSINDNERIVILSNDTSLRIKAMAEGLICETATEFRDTLVNPFSERFLWSESSPRGRTWSCQDDLILREQFYSHGSKNSSKRDDTVKGLKLIMAYNSRDKNTSSSMQWK
ncbi:hypothetical protein QQ045_021267 [Rhodiola kirilowii]